MSTSPATLIRLLIDVYTRYRRRELKVSQAYREASLLLDTLKASIARTLDHGPDRQKQYIEVVELPPEFAGEDLERLTPDGLPWNEDSADLSIDDIDLLQANLISRVRRHETSEKDARQELFMLRALRYALEQMPGDAERTTIILTYCEGVAQSGGISRDALEPPPPWPIRCGGEIVGYFVPRSKAREPLQC